MPTYEYRCDECGFEFEELQLMSDPAIKICPNCGGIPTRKISGGGILIFKGKGFYETDYKKPLNPPKEPKEEK
jgi:putative FmdB family regulatory protein